MIPSDHQNRSTVGFAQPNYAKGVGSWLGGLSGRMGGVNPLNGLLLGGGLGLLYHGIDDYLKPALRGERVGRKRAWRPVIIGGLAGLGIGGLSELLRSREREAAAAEQAQLLGHTKNNSEKRAFGYDPSQDVGRLVTLILSDPTLTESQKQNALSQLQRASRSTLAKLLMSSAGGALSGAILASLLGVGPLPGAALGGLLGSSLGRTFF